MSVGVGSENINLSMIFHILHSSIFSYTHLIVEYKMRIGQLQRQNHVLYFSISKIEDEIFKKVVEDDECATCEMTDSEVLDRNGDDAAATEK